MIKFHPGTVYEGLTDDLNITVIERTNYSLKIKLSNGKTATVALRVTTGCDTETTEYFKLGINNYYAKNPVMDQEQVTMMTPEQAKTLINELAPTTTERGEWTEKYILKSLTSDLRDYIGEAEIVELFSTFHKLAEHAPELATELIKVLAGMSGGNHD